MSSPLQIAIALHYWTRTGDYGGSYQDTPAHKDSPAVRDSIKCMLDAGLLCENACPGDSARYASTEALRVYVEALCGLPWPVQMWVIPKDEST